MLHYTTCQGRMHHFLFWLDLEEQVTNDFSYFVAVGPRAFEGGEIVCVTRHKPGMARVMLKHGNHCRIVFSRDEFLPSGVEVALPNHEAKENILENRKPINHDLKIHSQFFKEVISGWKTFEIRFNDRDFQPKDTITLHELHQEAEEEPVKTGRVCSATIGFVTSFFQRDGFVVFSLIDVKS